MIVGRGELEEFGGGHGATEIKIRDVDRAKGLVLGLDGMQGVLYCREISGGGRDRVGDCDSVTTAGAADASDDGIVALLLPGYLIVVGRGLGRFHAGGKDTGTSHELNEL